MRPQADLPLRHPDGRGSAVCGQCGQVKMANYRTGSVAQVVVVTLQSPTATPTRLFHRQEGLPARGELLPPRCRYCQE